MSVTKAVTLRLEPDDYDHLEIEATRLGLAPATLARVFVRAGLSGEPDARVATARQSALAALDALAALRGRLPDAEESVDAVRIIAEGRLERDQHLSP